MTWRVPRHSETGENKGGHNHSDLVRSTNPWQVSEQKGCSKPPTSYGFHEESPGIDPRNPSWKSMEIHGSLESIEMRILPGD
jgi:hypothetical protein